MNLRGMRTGLGGVSIDIPRTVEQVGAQREKEMREAEQRKQFDNIQQEIARSPLLPRVAEAIGIGDVTSTDKGSGARFNVGKPALDLIPLRLLAEQFERDIPCDSPLNAAIGALWNIALFQEGGDPNCLHEAIEAIGAAWDECAAVFEYGKRKYAAWNWAKGMPWSAVIASAARHLIYGLLAGEDVDKESGLPHRGHFLCNMVMLLTYVRTYPEGDDRPSQWLLVASKTQES
ncbi:dATP/dGTP diphosphohydrolase domain-containing protein [Burkholderia cenocepacia]|uniref:dATP/dGTP diphosphohydrolase domain-containing protein n=1 Tax=Burkholderia cenocepacia TaxID=95486 RepID=UPI002ABD8F20|nr:dATP/dGTP diphosphohydrolase domain-containing protein [Burkholderia cenocepacia]